MKLSAAGGVLVALFIVGLYVRSRRRRSHRKNLKDVVVLITGASSGLGEACAKVFYLTGCRIILCSRRLDQLQRVADSLKSLPSNVATHEPKLLQLDISKLADIPAAMATAIGLHGHIDVLVNNAGISYRGTTVDTSLDVDISVMNVNYFGQVAIVKALLPHMIQRRSGSLVAISSVQGKLALPHRSAYGASKHALESFFECLRAEVSSHNISVNVISPAYIRTNLSVNAVTGDGSQYGVEDETQKKGMEPDYVASQVLEAVQLRKNEVLLAPLSNRLAVCLRPLLPDLMFKIMARRALKPQAHSKTS